MLGDRTSRNCFLCLAFQTSGNNFWQKTCFNPILETWVVWLLVMLLGAMEEMFPYTYSWHKVLPET